MNMRNGRPVALVTGGTRGIGFGVAEKLAAEGYDLALCGRRRESEAADSLKALKAAGAAVLYASADIGSTEDRGKLLDAVRSEYGRLDLLVNNAGMAPRVRQDILEASEENYDEVMGVNLRGPYFLTQAAARWMVSESADVRSRCSIIFITSISSTVASPSRGEYCLSKAGLTMAARLWAVRLAEFGINVYEVRPGIIATDMTSGVKGKYDALIEDGLMLQRRWGSPEDIGRAVASLARGDWGYSTGQAICVDGGMTVGRL